MHLWLILRVNLSILLSLSLKSEIEGNMYHLTIIINKNYNVQTLTLEQYQVDSDQP